MSIIDQLEEALKNYQALAEEARKASAAIRDADEQTLGNMTKMNNLRADAQRSVRQLSAARIKLDQEKKKALKTNQAEVDQIEELTKAEGEFKDTMRDVKGAVDIAAQATNKLAGAQSDAGKAADGTATQFRNMFGAAVAVTQVFRTFGATNYLYERLQKGIDEQSEKMVASFGQVRTEAGDFADTLSGRLMQGTDELGQEILKLEYRLDNVNEPLKFLPPGIAGSQKAFELFRTAADGRRDAGPAAAPLRVERLLASFSQVLYQCRLSERPVLPRGDARQVGQDGARHGRKSLAGRRVVFPQTIRASGHDCGRHGDRLVVEKEGILRNNGNVGRRVHRCFSLF